MPDRWQRLQEAVEQAADLEETAAMALLEASLGDDDALLDEAKRVLAAGRRTDGFLEPAPRTGTVRSLEGAHIGPFEILEVLGEGGMGTVFLARQETPHRTVALKVLSRPLLSDAALARFRYEVQALASLRHRGIAQVYETGIDIVGDGPARHETPWFAMEYVEGGRSVLVYAEDERLDTRARLQLFAEVCEAVHHGHQKGIVHRDLKPDNVLVNPAGHPKVIDFGVARAADPEKVLTTIRAGAGEIAGTLPYMSPEQLAGTEVHGDVRADVYALGVVLYQLMVGSLPIAVDSTDFITSARRICEDLPRRPSTVRKSLRGDLETILLKALEKDPERRYASADALAADVVRYLDRRPIEARPPSALYQLRLFARRHVALVVAAAFVLIVSVSAAIVSVGFAVRSREAEQDAVRQKDVAVEQGQRSDKLFQTLLTRSFTSTTKLAPLIHELQGGLGLVRRMMTSVLEDIKVLEGLAGDDSRVRVLLAEAYMGLGDTQGNRFYRNLDDLEGARASYEKALAVLEGIPTSDAKYDSAKRAELRVRRKLAELVGQGRSRELGDRKEELEAILAEAKTLAARRPEWTRTIVTDVALIHFRLAEVALMRRAFDEGEPHLRETIRLATAVDNEELVIDAKTALADNLLFNDRAAEAKPLFAEVLAATEAAAMADDATYVRRFGFAVAWGRHGSASAQSDDLEAAETSWARAAKIFGDLFERDPDDRRVLIQLQMVLTWLSSMTAKRALADGVEEDVRRRLLETAIGYYERAAESLESAGGGGSRRAGMIASIRRKIAAIRKALDAR